MLVVRTSLYHQSAQPLSDCTYVGPAFYWAAVKLNLAAVCRLCERQTKSGGLNGRPEKLQDVCYSWWCLTALSILDRLHWIDRDALSSFILQCQVCSSSCLVPRARINAVTADCIYLALHSCQPFSIMQIMSTLKHMCGGCGDDACMCHDAG